MPDANDRASRRTAAAALALVTVLAGDAVRAARPGGGGGEEERLVAVLRSSKPAAEKAAACARLKRIGTAKAAAALGELLADKALSHSARYALESMPCPQAGEALRAALTKTAAVLRVGIIDSLGKRGERAAVAALAKLLTGGDAATSAAAAAALGEIGGAEALGALKSARSRVPAAAGPAVLDAILLCADRLAADGDAKAAQGLYRELYDSRAAHHVRTAAYRGLVRTAGDRAAALVTAALTGTDPDALRAALQQVRRIDGRAATKAFAAALNKVPAGVRPALLAALAQRGDRAAAPAVVAATKSEVQAVRVAALKALGALGDASCAALLAEAAAGGQGPQRKAARASLLRLRAGDVAAAILAHLPKAAPAARAELLRALGRRGERSAVPALLKMARGADESLRAAAVEALGLLAGDEHVDELIGLLVRASDDALRASAEQALASVVARSGRSKALVAPLLAARKGAGVAARCALLRLAARIGGAEALAALRAGTRDAEAAVRDAAIRAMADYAGAEALGDLLRLAREGGDETHRVLALRGYWRLVAVARERPAEARLAMCEAGLAAARRVEEKKLGLAELAKVGHREALKLAERLCEDASVRSEAESASVRIAVLLSQAHPAAARAALQRLGRGAKDGGARAAASKALDAMQRYVGYVTGWQVAGPFRRKGMQCRELFDVAFAPELRGKKAAWKPLPPPQDASRFWQADLSKGVGGDHAVMYLKARVHAPKALAVRLDIGSDDGVKLWVNGKLVHANNAVRGLRAGEDKARAELREGWNELLLKITQHTMGCGACVRIRAADGSIVEGLRFAASGG